MQFNLKNIVKNLLSIYDNIFIEDSNLSEKKIHDKKLNILVKRFKEYLYQDIESAKSYLELMQIEYFLLTEFSDITNDDFIYCVDKIENIILRSCHLEQKVFSDNCIIKELDENICKDFINTYHIDNYIESDIKLGLFKNNELLCCNGDF